MKHSPSPAPSNPFSPWAILQTTANLPRRIWRGVQRLLRQPRLNWTATILEAGTREEIVAQALAIAAANVKQCIEPRRLLNGEEKMVLCAGVRNFREPWARDFGFATFGLLSLGETTVVREGLEAFLLYQTAAGQFPVKLHSTGVLERYLHSLLGREQPTEKPLRPKYITAHHTVSLDGNSLLVIAALHYAKHTGDYAFIRQHWQGLCSAITWLENYALENDGLLHQGAYTDWADSIARTGRVLYTNVLYWKAVDSLAEASVYCEDEIQQQRRRTKANWLQENLQRHFWREDLGYYITSEQFNNLSSSGNTLAVVWGLASEAQSHMILDAMHRLQMAVPVPTQAVSHPYRRRYVAVENHVARIPEYHTHAAWLWLGGWHIIALVQMNRLTEAALLLDRMSAVIVQDGVVHEVYGKNGRFLSTPLYTSEAPLTWNASMAVHAFDRLKQSQLRAEKTPQSSPLSSL